MAAAGTLQDAFIDELRDAYDGERQLTKALAKLAKAATAPELREAFESHLEETHGQIQRLEQVFETLESKARGKHCEGLAGIIEEGKAVMEEDFDDATMDACLIAAGQRAEHYEIAAYGTLVAWAQVLGHDEAAELLQQTLDEEKAADEKLSGLAESGINQSAADASEPEDDSDDSDEDEDEDEDESEDESEDEEEEADARPVGRGAKKAARATPKPAARRR
jgi:ferritin-like metal-binding protein YciE